jgi:hypothetical protein
MNRYVTAHPWSPALASAETASPTRLAIHAAISDLRRLRNSSFGTTPLYPCYEIMEHRGVKYAVVKDKRLGLWRWSVLVGRPEMLRIGDADSEQKAEAAVKAVIDRALALQKSLRGRDSRWMPKNSNKPWSPDEDEHLLGLKAAGKSHGVIGAALGRSTGAIIGRLSILNTRTARAKRERAASEN